jgi:hypothetical protein
MNRCCCLGLCGGLEHLKIYTRLIDERFPSVMGEFVFGENYKISYIYIYIYIYIYRYIHIDIHIYTYILPQGEGRDHKKF